MDYVQVTEDILHGILFRNRRYFLATISFPRTVDEFVGMILKNAPDAPPGEVRVDLDYILDGSTDWALPRSISPGDRVFWCMSDNVRNRISALRDALAEADSAERKGLAGESLLHKLDEARGESEPLASKIFAVGVVTGFAAFGINPLPRHFQGVTYAQVDGIQVFTNPIPLKALLSAIPEQAVRREDDIVEVHPYMGLPVLVELLRKAGNLLPPSLEPPF